MSFIDNSKHPFASKILKIVLANKAGIASPGSGIYLDILVKNEECEFHRIEFNESMFDIFPSGVLIVRDLKDVLSRIINLDIDYIQIIFENSGPVNLYIHSVHHANNAASRDEESYIAIHFSNNFYEYCQQNTLTRIAISEKPRVYRIDKFIEDISRVINESQSAADVAVFGPILNPDGSVIDPTNNYMVYRPLNPKLDGTEVISDNIAEYINYITNYAVPLDGYFTPDLSKKPRFFCWTDWGNHILFKAFEALDPITPYNVSYKYAITTSDAATVMINGKEYKKIYNYNTNQGGQFITKQYYYVRKTPKILDYVAGQTGNTYRNLYYQFLDDGDKFNTEIVGNTGSNYAQPGSQELKYSGLWGYIDTSKTESKNSITSHISGELGNSNSFKAFSIDGLSGFFNYYDHGEIWKNVFDLTPVDPFYDGTIGSPISLDDATNSSLQKVLNIRYESAKKNKLNPDKDQLALIKKIEAQNFILYSLCCMGEEDTSFFALLDSYYYNSDYDINPKTERSWLYGWKKIVPQKITTQGALLPGGTFTDVDMKLMRGWTFDNSETSGPYAPENYHKYAINLNERGNSGSATTPDSHFNPGWEQSSGGFKYRPIGIKGNATSFTTNNQGGSAFQVVKMYKKSWISVLSEAGITMMDEGYSGKNLYYFISENVVDGTC